MVSEGSRGLTVSARRAGCSAVQMNLSCVPHLFEHCSPCMRRTYMRADDPYTSLAGQTLLRLDPLLMRGGAFRRVRVPSRSDRVHTSHRSPSPVALALCK